MYRLSVLVLYLCNTTNSRRMIKSSNQRDMDAIGEYLERVPYDVSRVSLYGASDLYAGYRPDNPDSFAQCYDSRVYRHYMEQGKKASLPQEALARSLHDHHVSMAMNEFLATRDARLSVGIMGGHALLRTDKMYREIVLISKQLTEMGFLMISGGGPGAMEATHLGAWMAGYDDESTEKAIGMLAVAPSFHDKTWLATAFEVIRCFPQTTFRSLGIPTWLYGHEPATPFATHIAKLFENSVREDNILTLAYGGIIYTPGSAGTMQEIFQEAVQNHYLSFGFSSPMIFMGKQFWTEEMPVYTLLEGLVESGKYKNLLLSLSDDAAEIIDHIVSFNRQELQKD